MLPDDVPKWKHIQIKKKIDPWFILTCLCPTVNDREKVADKKSRDVDPQGQMDQRLTLLGGTGQGLRESEIPCVFCKD